MQRSQGNLPGDDPIGRKRDIERPYSVLASMPADLLSNLNVFFLFFTVLPIVKLSAFFAEMLAGGQP